MKTLLKPLSVALCSTIALFAALPASAQATPRQTTPQPRITAPIDNAVRATLTGSRPPRADPADDIGAVPSSMKLQGISLVFSRSAAQQTALNHLLAAQQNPASPLYHHWLTPIQYGAQFGAAPADIAAVEDWLEQQGFSIDSVSRSRTRIFFSGTAGQVASAFGAPLHYYLIPASGNQPAKTRFAPSTDLTIPSALAPSVLTISNLSDFRPHPHVTLHAPQPRPRYTLSSADGGDNFLTPADVATIYDITPATGAGYNGAGETIAVVGQSAISTTDLTDFQTAAGLPSKLPTLILMPGTGTSTINPGCTSSNPNCSTDTDEVESDLDLEYSDAIAQGATIDFIYTGSNTNYGVFDSLQYAVDEQGSTVTTTSGTSVPFDATIISTSYGECEPMLGSTDYASLNAILEQAASQGQTVVAAAGDDGSTDCNGEYSTKDTADNEQLAVDFPASSQYVTGMGGTEFPVADIAPGSTYFDAASSTAQVSTAKSYIPEQVWNDDAGDVSLGATTPSPIGAGGGGVSIYTPLPSWQTGVPGIPTSTYRLVPDLALYASSSEPDVAANTFYGGYLFCSSDTAIWAPASTGYPAQSGSCTNAFFDSTGYYLTIAGGTSFDAPIFSGMLAIINQYKGFTPTNGQGVINPTLYTLASNATTYASAFHDITAGGNNCTAGTTYCGTGPQTSDYAATTGYDEASGLGSVDLYNLMSAWTAGTAPTAPVIPGTFTVGANSVTLASGSSTTGTITITPASGYTGTVNLTVSDSSLTDGCVLLTSGSAAVTSAAAVTVSYTVDTSSSACSTAGAVKLGNQKAASLHPGPRTPNSPWRQMPIPATLAGTFLLACFRKRSRLVRAGIGLGLVLMLSFGCLNLTGCSGSSSTTTTTTTTTTNDTPPATYTITVTGTDSKTSTTTAMGSFTVTVS